MFMWKLGRLWMRMRKDLALVWALLRDPASPRGAKLAAIAAILYVISPIDLIPDAIPILGWLDDGLIATLLVQLAIHLLPPELHATLKARIADRQAARRS